MRWFSSLCISQMMPGRFSFNKPLRPAKHFDFRAFHVALEKIRRRLRPAVIIQRHRTHLNRVFRSCRNDVAKSAVGRVIRGLKPFNSYANDLLISTNVLAHQVPSSQPTCPSPLMHRASSMWSDSTRRPPSGHSIPSESAKKAPYDCSHAQLCAMQRPAFNSQCARGGAHSRISRPES